MPTLNGARQEYERYFSGIWGHFPGCRIFRHKGTKFTHTSFCKTSFNIGLYSTLFLLPKCMAESFTSTSCIIFSGLQMASVRAKDLFNLMKFWHPYYVFGQGIHFVLYHRRVLKLTTFYPLK